MDSELDLSEFWHPLQNVLKRKQRVRVGSFVLVYSIDNKNETVIFLNFENHDKVYR